MTEDGQQGRYSLHFFLAMLANSLFFASMHLLLWALPLYLSLSLSGAAAVGLVIGLMAVTAVLFRPLAGPWADRYGRRPLLLLGALCFAMAPLLYAFASSLPLLIAGRLMQGLGICFFTTGYGSLIPDLAMPGRRGEAIGLGSIALPLSLMIAPQVGAAVQESFGFQALFFAASATALAAFVVALCLPLGNSAAGSQMPPIRFREVLSRARLRAALASVFVLALAYSSLFTFLPLFATERQIPDGSTFFVGYGASLVLANTLVGRLSDRWGRLRVIAPAMVGVAVCLLLLAQVRYLYVLLPLAVLYGLCQGASRISLDAFTVDSVPLEGRGSAVSLEFAVYDLGIGVGSWGLGAVADAVGYGGMYAVMGGSVLAGLVVSGALLRRANRAA